MKTRLFALLLTAMISSGIHVMAQFGLPKIPSIPTGPEDIDVFKTAQGVGNMAKGAGGISLKEELAIGGSVAVAIVSQNEGLWQDETATRRVALIGKTLARYAEAPHLKFRFGILNNKAVNGFSAPGGYVFITKGLYDALQDDNELAGVLAHEISHIVARHALRVISRGQFVKGMSQVASGTTGDFGAFDEGISAVTTTLLDKGYDPGMEFDADKKGRQLASDAGFERNGLQRFLKSLQSKEADKSYLFSTHPPLKHRLERLDKF